METTITNPYVGLRPFNDSESLLFFGRNDQTLALMQKLHEHHFVAVVGSSGCGKSSLLRAGLIPSLKAGYMVDDSDKWLIAIMKPGQAPLNNLAKALLEQLYETTDKDAIEQLVQTIEEEGADAIIQLLGGLKEKRSTNFFLLVDQFEELFRFASESQNQMERDRAIDFVNIILELAQQQELPIYVVLTMRSDFIGDCSEFHGLPEAMNKSLYLVPRLNRQQLKMVIEGPAKLFGAKVNASLTSKLLNELGKIKDELPLLQHALMRMWDHEAHIGKDGEVNLDDYNAIGGIEKALSIHADEALKSLSKEEFQIAKQLFQALTTVDEHGRKTRRPVRFKELMDLTGSDQKTLNKVIQAFIKDRRSFLMIDHALDTTESIIDISHESLIRQWGRLGRWVEEEGDAAANYHKLTQDFGLYREGKKDFLTGTELELALEWSKSFKPTQGWAQRYNEDFEGCMEYLANSQKANEAAVHKAKVKKRNYQIVLTSLISLLVIAAGLWGFNEVKEANERAEEANHKMEVLLEEAKTMLQEANVDNTQNTGQGNEYLEGYKDVLNFIESQQAFYVGDKKPDEVGLYVYDPDVDQFQADAGELWKVALDSIASRENRIDRSTWKNALSSNNIKGYRDYLKTTEAFRFSTAAQHITEAKAALQQLESVDPDWIPASTKNTVNAYVDYLKNLRDEFGSEENVPLEKRKYIDSAFTRIKESRQGWLFAGREGSSGRMDEKDRVFSVVFRNGLETVDPRAIPQKGDLVRMRTMTPRSVYNDFTGSSVVNKKSVIIRQDDYALVKEVEQLKAGAVFIQINY